MPGVVRQTARGQPKPDVEAGGGVLSRIAGVKPVSVDKQKWAIYGQPKTGKTRFACSFKKPLLLIGAEDGTASVVGMKGVDFVQVQSLAEYSELVAEVRSSGRWASVVTDTLSKLRDMRIVELFNEKGGSIPEKKPFMYADKAWKEVWTQTGKDLKDALRPLLDAPRLMDLNVLTISQEANLVFDDGNSASSDLIRPSVGSAIGKSLCDWLHAECDYIGQTMIRPQMKTTNLPGGLTASQPTGKLEYCMRVSPDGVYQAGFRLPSGRTMLKEFLIDPSYAQVCALIRGEKLG